MINPMSTIFIVSESRGFTELYTNLLCSEVTFLNLYLLLLFTDMFSHTRVKTQEYK